MSSHRSPCKQIAEVLGKHSICQVLGPWASALGPPRSHLGLRCARNRPRRASWLPEERAVLLLLQRAHRGFPLERGALPGSLLVRLRDLPWDQVDRWVAGRGLEAVLGLH